MMLVGVVATVATLVLVWSEAGAQQFPNATGEGGTSTLQVYSRLTVVDVTVTDADGQPIYGLQKSDFTISEDGKPQPIRNFEEVGLRRVMPLPELPPNVYSNLQPPAPSSAVNILLLDLENEAPVDSSAPEQVSASVAMQKRVKDAAKQALQQMPHGTRVAVLSMTNNLRILQSFSSDRALLAAAIDATPYDLDGNGDVQCVQSNNRNRMVLESLEQIAVSSAAVKGRKNLIWFTVGIPSITDPNDRPECLPDYSLGLSHAYDQLTAAQVSVYPISAVGVDRLGTRDLSMQMVAEATGGIAYSQSNDIASAVLKAINNGANYYSIAYSPPSQKYSGAYHKIDVKVDRPEVHVVFRKGYYSDDLAKDKVLAGLTFSMTPPQAYVGNMKAPMSRGMPTSQQILFEVGVEPSKVAPRPGDQVVLGTLDAKLRGRPLTRYGFSYVVPAQQITFANGANGTHQGALDFDIAVYDSNDKLLTGLSQIVKTTFSDTNYQKQISTKKSMRFYQEIDLPAGKLFVRVGVLDHSSNKTGTLELPLRVGKK